MKVVPADWVLLVNKKKIEDVCVSLATELDELVTGKDVVLAIILKGAMYFGTDLSRKLKTPHSIYCIEASSYKNKETQSETLEILSVIHPEKFKDKHVILLDELYDNGFTMSKVKEALLEKVPCLKENDVTTCVMFCKKKETKYPKPDIVGITIPDVWVVGYGLDDMQKMRNLENLYAKPKTTASKTPDDYLVFGS